MTPAWAIFYSIYFRFPSISFEPLYVFSPNIFLLTTVKIGICITISHSILYKQPFLFDFCSFWKSNVSYKTHKTESLQFYSFWLIFSIVNIIFQQINKSKPKPLPILSLFVMDKLAKFTKLPNTIAKYYNFVIKNVFLFLEITQPHEYVYLYIGLILFISLLVGRIWWVNRTLAQDKCSTERTLFDLLFPTVGPEIFQKLFQLKQIIYLNEFSYSILDKKIILILHTSMSL